MRLIIPALLAVLPATALAQEAPLTDATPEALIEALTPAPVMRFRGIKVTEAVPPSVDLAVESAYDSAELTETAKRLLANLAIALADNQLSGYRFNLAGHTDASGNDAYNQRLSEARAQSVQAFLSGEYGIAPARLEVTGFGETALLFPDAPNAPRNRRVEITTLE